MITRWRNEEMSYHHRVASVGLVVGAQLAVAITAPNIKQALIAKCQGMGVSTDHFHWNAKTGKPGLSFTKSRYVCVCICICIYLYIIAAESSHIGLMSDGTGRKYHCGRCGCRAPVRVIRVIRCKSNGNDSSKPCADTGHGNRNSI